jgi:aminomuconate-semialdehyde/2-hydroxymuconate-6-semialdehyde dehydrogenase
VPVEGGYRLTGRWGFGSAVWTNCFFVRDLRAPFGGFADSGWGPEGGTFSREFFTEPKACVMAIRQ